MLPPPPFLCIGAREVDGVCLASKLDTSEMYTVCTSTATACFAHTIKRHGQLIGPAGGQEGALAGHTQTDVL